jgi:hypothetical protein
MKKQIPPQDQTGTHFDRFRDLTKKVLTTSNEAYRTATENEKQQKTKKDPKSA